MTPDKTHFTFEFYRKGLRGARVRNATFLDFGCGALHPLDMSAIFYLNGAKRCFANDMAGLRDVQAASHAMLDLIRDCRAQPERWLLDGADRDVFFSRLDHFDEIHLHHGRYYQGCEKAPLVHAIGRIENIIRERIVDIVVSATVLEHVADLPGLARHFQRILAGTGVMYHNVDYSDHGVHADASLNYWSFMTNAHAIPDIENGGDINKLRNSEVERIFRDADFSVETDRLLWLEPPQEVLDDLSTAFQSLSDEDMRLVSTGLLITHAQ
jgi:hypothetical protein